MRLSVSERLGLASLFPAMSKTAGQLFVRDIAKKVALSQKEAEEVELSMVDNKLNPTKADALVREFEFTDAEMGYLKSRAAWAEENGKISQSNLSLTQKIQDEKCQTKE